MSATTPPDGLVEALGLPLVPEPRRDSGGRGQRLVRRAEDLVELGWLALGEPFDFPLAPRRVAGVHILHPGVGRIKAIEGVDAAAAVPNVRRVKLGGIPCPLSY